MKEATLNGVKISHIDDGEVAGAFQSTYTIDGKAFVVRTPKGQAGRYLKERLAREEAFLTEKGISLAEFVEACY